MADEVAAPPAPPAASGPVDYQAAALAALTQADQVQVPPDSSSPAPTPVESKPEGGKATEPDPATAPPATTPEPDKLAKNFEALTLEKAQLRKEREELKARQASVARLEAAEKALAAGDYMGVLNAHGIPYKALVEQLISGANADPDAAADKPGAPKKADPLATRLEQLEKQLQQERAQRYKEQIVGKFEATVKAAGEKYELVAAEPGGVQSALKLLEDHYDQTGQMPAATLDESIEIALDAMESSLSKRLSPLLQTKKAKAIAGLERNSGSTQNAVPQAASAQATQQKTLTNSQAASGTKAAPPEPKTDEDYRRAALALLNGP